MTNKNFKALGIDHYYAIGCRNGAYTFDIAYTSDESIAVALRNALEDTWKNHPNKRYRIHGFNGNGTVLEPYGKPHNDQYFWISALATFIPMDIGDKSIAIPLRINNSPRVGDTVAVFASYKMADKVGIRLMDSYKPYKTMNGFTINPCFYFDYRCPAISGEVLNNWFKEGQL